LPPSLMKTSSVASFTPRMPKSWAAISARSHSYPA
jgi:hypothetical protein